MQLSLKAARRRRKLTVSALADRVGVHKSTVSRIERGKVKPLHDTVVKLEDALDYKHGTLVFPEEQAS